MQVKPVSFLQKICWISMQFLPTHGKSNERQIEEKKIVKTRSENSPVLTWVEETKFFTFEILKF